MLRSNSKNLGNHVVSPEEEKERLQWKGFAEKEVFKSGMKERVGNGLHTHTVKQPFVRDYPGRPVPEETFIHSHPF